MIRSFWTAPNQLTLLRLVFVPLVVMNVLDYNFKWALGIFIAAGLSDALDGLLARMLHQRTTIGEYLDPIADKLLLSSLLSSCSLFGSRFPGGFHRRRLQSATSASCCCAR